MRLRDNPILRTHSRPNTPIKMAAMSVVSAVTLAVLCAVLSASLSGVRNAVGELLSGLILLSAGVVLVLVLVLSPALVSTCIARGRSTGAFEAERLTSMRPVDIALGYVLGPLRVPGLLGAVSGGVLLWALAESPWFDVVFAAVLLVAGWACSAVLSAWFSVAVRRPSNGPLGVALAAVCIAVAISALGIHPVQRGQDSPTGFTLEIGVLIVVTIGAWVGLVQSIRRPRSQHRWWSRSGSNKNPSRAALQTQRRGAIQAHPRAGSPHLHLPFPFPRWNNPLAQSAWRRQGRPALAVTALAVLAVGGCWAGSGTLSPELRASGIVDWWSAAQWLLTSAALLNLLHGTFTHRRSGMVDALMLSPMSRRDHFLGHCAAALTPVVGAMLVIALGAILGTVSVSRAGDDALGFAAAMAVIPAMMNMLIANVAALAAVAWVSLGLPDLKAATGAAITIGVAAGWASLWATKISTLGFLALLAVITLVVREATVELRRDGSASLLRKHSALLAVVVLVAFQHATSVGTPTARVAMRIPFILSTGLLGVLVAFFATLEPITKLSIRAARLESPRAWYGSSTAFAVAGALLVAAPTGVILGTSVYTPSLASAWVLSVVAAVTVIAALIEIGQLEPKTALRRSSAVVLLACLGIAVVAPVTAHFSGVNGADHWMFGWGIGPVLLGDLWHWDDLRVALRTSEPAPAVATATVWAFAVVQVVLAYGAIRVRHAGVVQLREKMAARGAGAGVR